MKIFELEFDPTCSRCSLEQAELLNVDFAHGCNTRGAMASGVAAAVAKNYTALVAADKHMANTGKVNLGSFIRHINRGSIRQPRSFIYNFYTQMFPGPGSLSYSAITQCFEKYFKERLTEIDNVKLIIPEIGCGRGGGFRLKVLHAIRKAFDRVEVPEGKSITVIMQIWGDGFMQDWNELHHQMQWALTSELDIPVEEIVVRAMSADNLMGEVAKSVSCLEILDYLEGV